MQQLHAGVLLEQLDDQMGQTANAGRTESYLAGIGLHISDQLMQILCRQRRVADKNTRRIDRS